MFKYGGQLRPRWNLAVWGGVARLLKSEVPPTPITPAVQRRTRQVQRRLAPADIGVLVADYLAGASASAVARTYRIDAKTATRHLSVRGITIRQHRLRITPELLPEVRALRAAGWTYKRIGDKYGCSRMTLYNALSTVTDDSNEGSS